MGMSIPDAIRALFSAPPAPSALPGADPEALVRAASIKAAALSGTLALPPGPIGALTLVPELMGVWRLQSQLVVDLAASYGQTARITPESLLFCVFKHGIAQAVARATRRFASRWLPLVGALGAGAFAYYDTARVGRAAIDFFGENS